MYWCKECGSVVSIGGKRDIVQCHKCGSEDYTASPKNLPKANAYSLLADVQAVLENIVEGEYRLFHSESMDQDTGLEEKIKNLYKKVSEHFS